MMQHLLWWVSEQLCVLRFPCSPFNCLSSPQSNILTCSLAGRELDLRRFHEAIEECGGFDAAVSNKKFGRIAVELGINLAVATNAAYLLKYALSFPLSVSPMMHFQNSNGRVVLQVSLSAVIGALPADCRIDRYCSTGTRRAGWRCYAA